MKKTLTLLIAAIAFTPALGLAQAKPLPTVKTAIDEVVAIWNDPAFTAEKYAEQRTKIRGVVDGVFDYTQLSRLALGRDWGKLNAAQQKEFVALFTELLADTYMKNLGEDRGTVTVKFEKETMLGARKAEVESILVTDGKEYPVNYRLYNNGSAWRIYDVHVEGVSLVANYRSQFSSLMNKGGPEKLLQQLREKSE